MDMDRPTIVSGSSSDRISVYGEARAAMGSRRNFPVCGYYPKNVACLQRSAATVWLLRRFGIPADLVIGVSKFPFKSHAWVEVEGRVVNDRQRVREVYATLDRWSAMTTCEDFDARDQTN